MAAFSTQWPEGLDDDVDRIALRFGSEPIGPGMDFREAAAAWLVAQCEPLVPALDRAVAEQAFVNTTAANPDRVLWWFSGLISDQAQSLPPTDPWRHLSARAGEGVTRGRLPKPPALTGAIGSHGTFGTLEDCTDLVHPSFSDSVTDIGLVAVASGIGHAAAALVAFGADGARACHSAAAAIHADLLGEVRDRQEAAARTLGACIDAARWVIWRRRAYVGIADDWALASGFAWLWRAEDLAAKGELPAGEWDEVERALQDAAIDPDTYRLITGT